MKAKHPFFTLVCLLAVPVALQSMLQASFGIVDQIMIGQLGSVQVAGVGLAGKFSSVFSVVVSAVGTVAGIMISQYLGQKNNPELRRSFRVNLGIALGIAALFSALCMAFSEEIMGLYTKDPQTCRAAAGYLSITAATFFPMAGATLLSVFLRCTENARLPLYASVASAILNTGLNYILIFGKCGFAPMGVNGSAIATVISQWANLLIMAVMTYSLGLWRGKKSGLTPTDGHTRPSGHEPLRRRTQNRKPAPSRPFQWRQYLSMLLPILVCEVLWSLGENVYAAIYGHMGTQASAAMTLINPIQGLMIGALCGLSQAAGILVGKMLGNKEYDQAFHASKRLLLYGAAGSALLSLAVVLTSGLYVNIYQVESSVRLLTRQILFAYALVAPFKVLNMILGGGIIRSGGKTTYVMVIDIIGTWFFGVPLGLLAAFILKLTIPYVYFLLSLEECVRFAISLVVFHRRKWMQSLS